jgi:CBS domain-containing protein
VSEADLLLKEEPGVAEEHLFEGRRRRLERAKSRGVIAREVMTTPVFSVSPNSTVGQAARLMHEKGVKRLPVTDPEGRVIGIVSRPDLLRVFLRPDTDIEREVVEEVLGRFVIEPGAVVAVVRHGVVLVRGRVERRSLIDTLVGLVRGVEGVVGVEDDLSWEVDDLAPPVLMTPWGATAGSLRP